MQVLDQALELLTEPQMRYREAKDGVRRLLNQAIFEKLFVLGDWIAGAVLTPWVAEAQALADEPGL